MVDLLDKPPLADAREHLSIRVLNRNGVHLSERPRQGLLRLQGDGEKIQYAVQAALSAGLPARANSFTKNGGHGVIWLGPKRWLVRCPHSSVAGIRMGLARSLEGIACQVVDASHQYVVLGLSGGRANELLKRCCSIDIDSPDFAAGSAVQTLFGRIPVLLQYEAAGPEYSLYVDQSLARFTWDWLTTIIQDNL